MSVVCCRQCGFGCILPSTKEPIKKPTGWLSYLKLRRTLRPCTCPSGDHCTLQSKDQEIIPSDASAWIHSPVLLHRATCPLECYLFSTTPHESQASIRDHSVPFSFLNPAPFGSSKGSFERSCRDLSIDVCFNSAFDPLTSFTAPSFSPSKRVHSYPWDQSSIK